MTSGLVSVVVVTYNSSKFVIETLESIYYQDYEDIELIISDDCSKDNTLDICNRWVETHKGRFSSVKVVSTPKNGGICANYNYALKFVNGKWIKYIAGDDLLLPNCISTLVKAANDSGRKIYFSALIPFSIENGKLTEKEPRKISEYCFATNNPGEQLERMFEKIYWVAEGPTLFLETETFRRLGGMDEKYPMLEDFPIAMKYAYNNLTVGYVASPLVRYREYQASVSQSNAKFDHMILVALRDYKMKVAFRKYRLLEWWHLHIYNIMEKNMMNNKPLALKLSKLLILTDLKALLHQ